MPSFPVGSLLLVSRQSAWNKRPYCCLVADGLVGNPMSELGQKRKFSTRAHVVRFTPECVAKLFAKLRTSNYRIRLNGVLNRCCAFGLFLESILLILVVKIVLQHIPPNSRQVGTATP